MRATNFSSYCFILDKNRRFVVELHVTFNLNDPIVLNAPKKTIGALKTIRSFNFNDAIVLNAPKKTIGAFKTIGSFKR